MTCLISYQCGVDWTLPSLLSACLVYTSWMGWCQCGLDRHFSYTSTPSFGYNRMNLVSQDLVLFLWWLALFPWSFLGVPWWFMERFLDSFIRVSWSFLVEKLVHSCHCSRSCLWKHSWSWQIKWLFLSNFGTSLDFTLFLSSLNLVCVHLYWSRLTYQGLRSAIVSWGLAPQELSFQISSKSPLLEAFVISFGRDLWTKWSWHKFFDQTLPYPCKRTWNVSMDFCCEVLFEL